MAGELTYSSAESPDTSSNAADNAAPPPVPSTNVTKLSTIKNSLRTTPEIKHRQARSPHGKSKKILSDGDLCSIIEMISKLEPVAADNTAPVQSDITCTSHQEGKGIRDTVEGENLKESSTVTNLNLTSQDDTPLSTTSTPKLPVPTEDEPQPTLSKSIDFAQSQKADLIISIGGITALVISSVVCHFSPLFRYMCTPGATKPVGLVPGLELELYQYFPRGAGPPESNLPVLSISSQGCWAKDKGESVILTLHAMHGNSAELPLELRDLPLMGRIAEFVWTYSCQRIMVPWFRIWLDRPVNINQRLEEVFRNRENSEFHLRSLGALVTVAIVMRDVSAVKSLWKMLLLLVPGDGAFVSQLTGCPTRILGELEGTLCAKRQTVLSEVTSILQHIYDVFVGKAKPHPPPEYLVGVLPNNIQSLGPCRHPQLAWFLCALEERLPSTGFLLSDPKQTSLAKVFTSLYQVAGDLESHHLRVANQNSKHDSTAGTSHIFCERLGRSLSRAIKRVHSKIEFTDCLELLDRSMVSRDSHPLTPLVVPSPPLKDVITRYDTLFREHNDQLHSSAKPDNNGWIFRWCAEWLAEVQGITDNFNWDWYVPRNNTGNALFGMPTSSTSSVSIVKSGTGSITSPMPASPVTQPTSQPNSASTINLATHSTINPIQAGQVAQSAPKAFTFSRTSACSTVNPIAASTVDSPAPQPASAPTTSLFHASLFQASIVSPASQHHQLVRRNRHLNP
ncbi:hypothetical protein EV426DRAFT_645452 [Tirmania nivea]|nr:hypothetical protein EV426DRAFT_645452 [Tirmania nivea]